MTVEKGTHPRCSGAITGVLTGLIPGRGRDATKGGQGQDRFMALLAARAWGANNGDSVIHVADKRGGDSGAEP